MGSECGAPIPHLPSPISPEQTWGTGEAARSEHVKRFFGLTPEHELVGFVYLGYPADERTAAPRVGHREKATWLGWPGE
jgi:hypothetical protein